MKTPPSKIIRCTALVLLGCGLVTALWCGVLWRWLPTAETFAPLPGMDADRAFVAVTPASADVAILRRQAEAVLLRPVVSITHKTQRAPSGDARDYVSLSIYWWPKPTGRGCTLRTPASSSAASTSR